MKFVIILSLSGHLGQILSHTNKKDFHLHTVLVNSGSFMPHMNILKVELWKWKMFGEIKKILEGSVEVSSHICLRQDKIFLNWFIQFKFAIKHYLVGGRST